MTRQAETSLAAVTGAAGGLGSAFARQLAARGHRLLLVDLQQEPLERLGEEISAQHGIAVEPWIADLSNRKDVERLAARLEEGQ